MSLTRSRVQSTRTHLANLLREVRADAAQADASEIEATFDPGSVGRPMTAVPPRSYRVMFPPWGGNMPTRHSPYFLGIDEWESEDRLGLSVVRDHAHEIGNLSGKAGVDVVAVTEGLRGAQPVTSPPLLSLWNTSGGVDLDATEARALAAVLVKAADELDRIGGAR